MIKKRYIPILLLVPSIAILAIIGVMCYGRLFRDSINDEAIFAATEIGTPIGDKVTKNIGPEGGTITSEDGRLTVTVPKDTLTEILPFSIQPITNTFQTGLGSSYRLEPEGRTFEAPLDISVHYDDRDLEGTFPEAVSIAYQDNDGAWHMQPGIDLDKENKTVTLPAMHFSVYAFIYLAKLSPAKATIHPGESVRIRSTYCSPLEMLLFPSRRKETWSCSEGHFALQGKGTMTYKDRDAIYTAPPKKPTPNFATVLFADDGALFIAEVPRPCTPSDTWHGISGKNDQFEWTRVPKRCFDKVKMAPELDTVRSVITIVEPGYTASGSDGPTSYSGVVCSLDKPFTVTASNNLVTFPLMFVPSSATAGTMSYTAARETLSMIGSGTYVIEGSDTETPKILAQTKSTLSSHGYSSSGGGPAHIILTPITTSECAGQ